MKRLAFVVGFIDGISLWSGKALSYLLFPLIAILVYGVVVRYAFDKPIIWGHETSVFIFGTIGFLAGAYALQREAHVRMDIIYNRFSPRGRAVVDVVMALFFFYFIIALLWKGGVYAAHSIVISEQSGSYWNPVLYPFKIVIPIAAFLILLQGIAKFIRDIFFIIHGRPLS